MGFSRQKYWSGLPCPSGDLPDPGIKSRSPTPWTDSLPFELPRKPQVITNWSDSWNRSLNILGVCPELGQWEEEMPDLTSSWRADRKGNLAAWDSECKLCCLSQGLISGRKRAEVCSVLAGVFVTWSTPLTTSVCWGILFLLLAFLSLTCVCLYWPTRRASGEEPLNTNWIILVIPHTS